MSKSAVIQEMYQAFGRGDIPAILEKFSDSIDWEYGGSTADVPWLQQRKGRDGVAAFFASHSEFEIQKFVPKVFLESGDVVVVLLDVEFVVKRTGKRVFEQDEVHIWWFDDQGKIARYRHQVDTYRHYLAYHK